MTNTVTVVKARGYQEHFKAKVIPGLGDIPARDDRGTLAVVTFDDGELAVVPSSRVVYGLDLVKRLEVDFDWQEGPEGSWGVRHAFGGPFIFYGEMGECMRWALRKSGL